MVFEAADDEMLGEPGERADEGDAEQDLAAVAGLAARRHHPADAARCADHLGRHQRAPGLAEADAQRRRQRRQRRGQVDVREQLAPVDIEANHICQSRRGW